jgi:hypothetical protein
LLPDEPVRWCLYTREQEEMRAWTARVGIPGEVLEPAPSRFVFLPAVVPESRASARALDARLTGAHPGPGA